MTALHTGVIIATIPRDCPCDAARSPMSGEGRGRQGLPTPSSTSVRIQVSPAQLAHFSHPQPGFDQQQRKS